MEGRSHSSCSLAVWRVFLWRRWWQQPDTEKMRRRRDWCSRNFWCFWGREPLLRSHSQRNWSWTHHRRLKRQWEAIQVNLRTCMTGWDAVMQMFSGVTHSDWGVQVSYQLCCRTQTKARTWKARQVRIWVRTEQSRGPEMRLDGGRRHTSSSHAGFRLTEDAKKPCKPLINDHFIQFQHTDFEYFSWYYLWRRWWEWWRCQWRGTGSLPDCWESVIRKDKIKLKSNRISTLSYQAGWLKVNWIVYVKCVLGVCKSPSRAAWHWCTGWCCTEPWTWTHRRM